MTKATSRDDEDPSQSEGSTSYSSDSDSESGSWKEKEARVFQMIKAKLHGKSTVKVMDVEEASEEEQSQQHDSAG